MALDADTLPDDPATLRAMLRDLVGALAHEKMLRIAAETERDAARVRIEQLDSHIALLNRNRFGARSEKLDPDLLNFGFEDSEQERAALAADADSKLTPAARAAKPRRNRGNLPTTCRASNAWSISPTRRARAAGASCTGSARTWPSAWISCPPSSACW
jgi:hypothetical protein